MPEARAFAGGGGVLLAAKKCRKGDNGGIESGRTGRISACDKAGLSKKGKRGADLGVDGVGRGGLEGAAKAGPHGSGRRRTGTGISNLSGDNVGDVSEDGARSVRRAEKVTTEVDEEAGCDESREGGQKAWDDEEEEALGGKEPTEPMPEANGGSESRLGREVVKVIRMR